jgi:hypothetical protein
LTGGTTETVVFFIVLKVGFYKLDSVGRRSFFGLGNKRGYAIVMAILNILSFVIALISGNNHFRKP